ncbi:MAG: inositol monophosphatase family protein [Promethearchaeota archaeon]
MWQAIKPVIGTSEASKDIGMNIYGQTTKKIDKIAEDACIDYIQKKNMSINLISEESGVSSFGDEPRYTLIIDPIDGSTNASRGVPFFSLSLAILDGMTLNDVIAGMIKAPLLLNYNLFEVEKGRGIKVDGMPISPRPIREQLSRAIVSLYFYDIDFERVKAIASRAYKTRLLGSIALELCYTAIGLLDALIDTRGSLKIMDIVAAKLFIEEAGGIITDNEGTLLTSNIFDISKRYSIVCATNHSLHQEIVNLLSG